MFNDTSSLLTFLKTRKSGSAKSMGAPGPSPEQIIELLDLAVRVPDHGKLTPWRFILFEGPAREEIGATFERRWSVLHPEHGEQIRGFVRNFFMRAPLVIAVISTAAPNPKIPEFEQLLSAAAVCFNIELAAAALGFVSQWQTDWVAYDREALAAMGVAAHEKLAGLIYIGTATAPLEDRPRPDAAALTTRWGG